MDVFPDHLREYGCISRSSHGIWMYFQIISGNMDVFPDHLMESAWFPGRHLMSSRKLLKNRRGSGHNASFRHNRSFKLKKDDGGSTCEQLGVTVSV